MASTVAVTTSGGDKQKEDDPMKQTILIIEHKIRNLEKRKLKLEGYLQQQRNGQQLLTGEQLSAASKYNEVTSNLDFAKNLKKQLSSLVATTKQKKKHIVDDEEKLPVKVDSKIKEVLIFENILECIKHEAVRQDLLTGYNGVVFTDNEISNLFHFSKMVSPKHNIAGGKLPKSFEDQLKTVAKHYSKLLDSKPNIVARTSYADLKKSLLKIEKSGYLNYISKNMTKTVEVNKSETIDNVQPVHYSNDCISDNTPMSNILDKINNENKMDKFTNNATYDQFENKNLAVFNTSFDFLQDSQLEDNLNTAPTKTFSLYSVPVVDNKILKVHPISSQNRTMDFDVHKEGNVNHLPRENWTTAQTGIGQNSDWIQSVQQGEVNKQQSFNGYTEDLNELLQKSLIFNKQDSYPVIVNNLNNPTFYQNDFSKHSSKNPTEYCTNSNVSYDRSQSNKFNNKRSLKPRIAYTDEAGGGKYSY